jgi:hypothetical protein
VVTSGNFLLGSESQLQGALANMLARTDSTAAAPVPAAAHTFVDEPRLADVLSAYYAIQTSLTKDSIEGIGAQGERITAAAQSDAIRKAAEPLVHASHKNDIESTREDFHALSDVLIAYVAQHPGALQKLPFPHRDGDDAGDVVMHGREQHGLGRAGLRRLVAGVQGQGGRVGEDPVGAAQGGEFGLKARVEH